MQIEASPVVTSCVRCNTSQQFLGTEEDARAAGYYACKYCGKDPVKLNIILPALYVVDQERQSTHPTDKSDMRATQFWLTRVLNNYSSMCEFSDTQIASLLMGIDSYHSSHKFWSFYAKSFVKYQQKEFKVEDIEHVQKTIVDDDMYHCIPQDETMDHEAEDGVVAVYRTKDDELLVRRQFEHYLHRGDELKDLSPYEWAATIKIEKIPPKAEEGAAPKASRRERNARFLFEDDGSGWRDTHRQVLRTKFVILHRDAFHHSFDVYDECQLSI